MALINVAINFGYEYFCFVIYFSKLFFKIFVLNFFFKFFFKIFVLKFFAENFFSNFFQNFVPTFFQNFFLFEGFTLDAFPFIETEQTVSICVMKNMIYSKRSKLDFSLA